jgi:hypothetical protein
MLKLLALVFATPLFLAAAANAQTATDRQYEYKLLATNRVATMEKEMNETAAVGYGFEEAVSGETSFGGSEVVVIMSRPAGASKPRYQYKLLATSKTSTMQKEMQEAGDAGFMHREETVFKKTFGAEVTVILEKDLIEPGLAYDYKLLATRKTSTLQKEMSEAGAEGYEFVGVTNGETAFGGTEVVAIMRRPKRR